MCCAFHTVAWPSSLLLHGSSGSTAQVVLCHLSEQTGNFLTFQKTCSGLLPCDLGAGCLPPESFVKKILWLGVSQMAPVFHQSPSTAGFPELPSFPQQLGHEHFQKENLAPQRCDRKANPVPQCTRVLWAVMTPKPVYATGLKLAALESQWFCH